MPYCTLLTRYNINWLEPTIGGIVMKHVVFKKLLAFLMVFIILCLSVPVGATEVLSGSCGDNLNWHIENGVLTISGTGDMYNWTSDEPSPFAGLADVETVNIGSGITSIGNRAFIYCESIKTVNIADSVGAIGNYAFSSCSSLEYINWGNGIKSIGENAFAHTNIHSVAMPGSVESVGEYAFEGCSSLEKVYVSEKLKTIPYGCFCFCEDLIYVTIPEGVERIESDAFLYHGIWELYIPESLTYLGTAAFDSKVEIETVFYGGTREQFDLINDEGSCIGYAYETMYMCDIDNSYGYDMLSDGTVKLIDCFAVRPNLEIPETIDGYIVSEIGDNLYRGKLITSVNIPSSIKRIGAGVFEHTDIRNVTIPSTVEYIGDGAFSGIRTLENINVDSLNENYCEVDGNLYTKDMSRIVSYCNGKKDKKFEIPKSVKIIDNDCFESSPNLCDIIIPNGAETIGENAFGNIKNLKTIDIPASVSLIGELPFLDCENLESINVDDNNPCYFDDDGVLLQTVKSEYAYILQYPPAKKGLVYRIPDGTVRLREMSFFNNSYLKTLLVPDSLIYVERDATFKTFIDKIYYEGTQQQFKEINDYRQLRNNYIEYEYDISIDAKYADVVICQQDNVVSCDVNLEYCIKDMVVFAALFDGSGALAHVEIVPVSKDLLNNSKQFETDKTLLGNQCYVYAFSNTSSVKPILNPVSTKVYMLENTDVVLETLHPLDSSQTLTYTYPGECVAMKIAFSSDTEVHESREYIAIYDNNNNLIGEYSGSELAGKVIIIPGNHVEIYVRSRYQQLYGVKTDYIQIIK